MDRLLDNNKYAERISLAIAYISNHLDSDLSLHRLAQISFMSPYHFHRTYRIFQGETITFTVRRMRMQHANYLLMQSDLSIEKIAKKCGYTNVQSFTRTFKSFFGIPPASYRIQNKSKKST